MNNIIHKTFAEIDLQDPFFQSLKRLFRGNGGLKTSTTPVFIPIRRHSTFG